MSNRESSADRSRCQCEQKQPYQTHGRIEYELVGLRARDTTELGVGGGGQHARLHGLGQLQALVVALPQPLHSCEGRVDKRDACVEGAEQDRAMCNCK